MWHFLICLTRSGCTSGVCRSALNYNVARSVVSHGISRSQNQAGALQLVLHPCTMWMILVLAIGADGLDY